MVQKGANKKGLRITTNLYKRENLPIGCNGCNPAYNTETSRCERLRTEKPILVGDPNQIAGDAKHRMAGNDSLGIWNRTTI